MPNEFDDILKDKLSGYSADFNSADWQKMEAMLPKQSRKPYALIALLFLSVGFAGLFFGTGESKQENYSAVIESEKNSLEENSVAGLQINSETDKAADKNNAAVRDIQKQNTEQAKAIRNTNTTESGSSKSSEGVWTPSPVGEGRDEVASEGEQFFDRRKISVESKKSKADNSQTYSTPKSGASSKSTSSQSTSFSISETEPPYSDFQSENNDALFALASIEAGIIKLDDEKNLAERSALSDDAAPKHKPKKKIATFALGGGAGMNFSFIESTRWTKPGYTVDIAQELMFINRIGLALTQGYTERKYEGQYPCSVGTLDCPYSYNSTVRSVDFSVALKANLIHKTKWNWYVKGGVISTVKLKEEFSYNYPQTDTIYPPTLPPQTNFNGSGFGTSESMSDPNLGFDAGSSPSDLSISGAKRYHIAFLSATGFDVALKPNLNVQVEANHSFTQPTVGADNKRLHTIGINARCLYLFGR